MFGPSIPLANLGHPANRQLGSWWRPGPINGNGPLLPDIGGRQKHTVLVGGVTYDEVPPPYGSSGSLAISGTQYCESLQLPNVPTLHASCWFRWKSGTNGNFTSAMHAQRSISENPGHSYAGFLFEVDNSIVKFSIGYGGGESTKLVGSTLSSDRWYFLEAICDGANMRLKTDGIEVASQAQPGAISWDAGFGAVIAVWLGYKVFGGTSYTTDARFSAYNNANLYVESCQGNPTMLSRPRRNWVKAAGGGGGTMPIFHHHRIMQGAA